MAILESAPNPELANLFINFILRPEVGAQLTDYVYYATPNEAAEELVDEEIRDNPIIFLDEETINRLTFAEDVENLELYDLVWTQVRSR